MIIKLNNLIIKMNTIKLIKASLEVLEKNVLELKNLKLTKEKIIELINTGSRINSDIFNKFKGDYDVNMAYFVTRRTFYDDESKKLFFKNEKFFIEAMKKGAVRGWRFFHEEIVTNENLFKEVIKHTPFYYNKLRDELKVDRKYNELLLKEGADILFFMKEFRDDPDMVNLFLDNVKDPYFANIYIPEALKGNSEIIIKYIGLYGDKITYDLIDEKLFENNDFLTKIKEICPEFIDNIPFKIIKNIGFFSFNHLK